MQGDIQKHQPCDDAEHNKYAICIDTKLHSTISNSSIGILTVLCLSPVNITLKNESVTYFFITSQLHPGCGKITS